MLIIFNVKGCVQKRIIGCSSRHMAKVYRTKGDNCYLAKQSYNVIQVDSMLTNKKPANGGKASNQKMLWSRIQIVRGVIILKLLTLEEANIQNTLWIH
jgi:hypothetical protein